MACGSPAGQRGRQCGGAEVADPVGADQPSARACVEGTERLRQRHLRVELVGEVQLDAVDPEPFQARAQLAGDPLGRRPWSAPACMGLIGLGRELRADGRARRSSGRSPLAAAAAVGVGGVEVGDAELPGGVHQLERLVLVSPWPKNSGAEPTPPKLPQPSAIRET
jgi:hypothetical protein